jgi:hypothetical protein
MAKGLMSALGQKLPRRGQVAMSALSPKAAAAIADRRVRFGPKADSCAATKESYSITSSAIASTPDGIVRPNALAVLRLMTSSTFVDRSTGKSAGFAPLRIFPVPTGVPLKIIGPTGEDLHVGFDLAPGTTNVACQRCARKQQTADLALCLTAGWWSPWGLFITPFFVAFNIAGVLRHPNAGRPSERFHKHGCYLATASPCED